MKTENLNPPDPPKTISCPDCYGGDNNCNTCHGTGEIVINEADEESRHVDDMIDMEREERL